MDISKIPRNPGVYIFKDKDSGIIYIGKAKSLKARVSSYFNKSTDHSAKTRHLVGRINDIEYIVVDNEVEALLLENLLIKKHKPKYNIALKDSKTFAYILITSEEYPKILSTRKSGKNGNYFVPFTDGFSRIELIKLVVSLFKLRTCSKMPKRPCLNYFIGTCTAPCAKHVSKEDYKKQVADALSFLKGNTHEVIERLQEEMKSASKNLRFEAALKIKKQIESINHLKEKQKVDRIARTDQNVVAMQIMDDRAVIEVFTISKGAILAKKEFNLEYEEEIFENFIKIYYYAANIPDEIIVSHEFWKNDDEKSIIEEYLERLKGSKVLLTYPYRGDKLALVEMAIKNINLSSNPVALKNIKEKLKLPCIPRTIECFDISNLSYDYVVGAMVQYVNGKPNPSGYRRFEIKSFRGANDFSAISEIVSRRYGRLQRENAPYPDLIIIDGGIGQLRSALSALKLIGVSIPAIALAKKNEEIYVPGMNIPIAVPINSPMMLLLRQIRDNVHRFALSYNRKKRQMRLRDDASNID